jgi:sec-independent protein translocase protein TatA
MPGGWEWLIIIGVLVLLFGAKRLPEMARSVGQSARVFKGEMKGLRDDEKPGAQPPAQPATPAPPAALPPATGQATGPVDAQPGEPVRRDPVRPDTDR